MTRPTGSPFGAWVRAQRSARGETQADVAEAVGLTCASTITYWETRGHAPHDSTLVALARHWDTPVGEIAALIPRFAHVLTDPTLGGSIRRARWDRWESRERLAARVRSQVDSVWAWERNTVVPTARKLALLELALGVELRRDVPPPSTPLPWVGSKARYLRRLLPLVPALGTYVEPFGGSAAVLMAREPARREVYNDVDGDLTNLFDALRDTGRADELKHRLSLTLYSRAEHAKALRILNSPGAGADDRAWAFFVAVSQSFNFRPDGGWAPRHGAHMDAWWKRVAFVDGWHQRLARVLIEQDDAVDVIERYDSGDTVFFVDPPYPRSARRTRYALYRHEFRDHGRLIDVLLAARGAVLVAGYDHPLYRALEEHGWRRTEIARRERIWLNPAASDTAAKNAA